ncbi:bifunctional phosphoribosylaminoimidazolecarboxamide formyltransferase/IMP cyclohydrolase [candidate division FCPU426 bacterium]|nr:bifunctional phosphoribosylaminoimidazolecarboxamide formyltransferase/IMP cyclohydrolase [candidate division FCPU426 bacterium]
MVKVKRALLSVSDKTQIVELGRGLAKHGVELLSTGGTARVLKEAGLAVKDVAEVTGFPEMMDGRVKTLHPKIHGGLLALRGNPEHMRQLTEQEIAPIDMVVVNLYPFAKTVARPDVSLEEAIENIDIGGPSMIRSASKNYLSVAVVVKPARYAALLGEMDASGGQIGDDTLKALAVEAFDHTAEYDAAIHRFLQSRLIPQDAVFPDVIRFTFHKQQALRYGENPHQQAAFYRQVLNTAGASEASVSSAKQLHGKELSFNNIIDIQAALEPVKDFTEPAACIIKHTNPCGLAVGKDITEAFNKALAADAVSAFGGIVGLNRPCTAGIVDAMKDIFMECIIAPGFEPEALESLQNRKNIRLLETGLPGKNGKGLQSWQEMDLKRVTGGLLLQDWDRGMAAEGDLKVVTRRKPTEAEMLDLLFAWKVCKHVKSNAILLAKEGVTVGVGPGQTNRVGAAEIAVRMAGPKAKGSVLASDAFFPFRDGIDAAAKAGVTAVIQPGGSVKDEEVIAAANEHQIAMVFTGMRHFKH